MVRADGRLGWGQVPFDTSHQQQLAPSRTPWAPSCPQPQNTALLRMLLVTELRQSPGRSLACWAPKKQSTQAGETLCYSLICSWLNATLRTNYFILKHL